MDTTWLNDFLAVVDEGSFSRAAERRAITQPAFSRRIRALEAWVGAPLFDRSSHAICLTPAGERFRPAVSRLLRDLAASRDDAVSAARHGARSLSFAATHALSSTFFPAWLRGLEATAPLDATLQLTADNMAACERMMLEGRAHFLICHHHPAAEWRLKADQFRSTVLGTDVLLPVAAPAVAARGAGPEQPHLAFAPDSGMGRILAAIWAGTGVRRQPEPVFTSHLATALVNMARDGRGVAWAPLSLVADDLAAGRLARAGEGADDVAVEIRLFRARAARSAAVEAFWTRLCPAPSTAPR